MHSQRGEQPTRCGMYKCGVKKLISVLYLCIAGQNGALCPKVCDFGGGVDFYDRYLVYG